mmetsp:Transcript_6528/g.18834  ORF Transcript_6528/g.18834 Transcript_6528/m.18834 type:complete len:216 (-) Transcript_6528:1354-2001(-)
MRPLHSSPGASPNAALRYTGRPAGDAGEASSRSRSPVSISEWSDMTHGSQERPARTPPGGDAMAVGGERMGDGISDCDASTDRGGGCSGAGRGRGAAAPKAAAGAAVGTAAAATGAAAGDGTSVDAAGAGGVCSRVECAMGTPGASASSAPHWEMSASEKPSSDSKAESLKPGEGGTPATAAACTGDPTGKVPATNCRTTSPLRGFAGEIGRPAM